MRKHRWLLAFGIWLLAAIIAASVAIIAVKIYRAAREKPAPPQIIPRPVPPPEPPKIPTTKEGPKAAPQIKTEIKKPPEKPDKPPAVQVPNVDDGKLALCPGVSTERIGLSGDGTLLGHVPYANANPSDLTSPPSGFGGGNCSQMQGEAKIALERMIEAARTQDPAIGNAMIGLSCFRSSTYQKEVFCRKVGEGFAARARASAPPGYSEHATGYAMDIGDRGHPECNLNPCFADTPVGQWLASNAGNYGFVLSFPKGNAQGVMYEPWHWRYEGSGAAKSVFVNAR